MSRMTRKSPRIVRWVLLCLLSWTATFAVFLISTEAAIAAHLLGSNTIAVTNTTRVELRHGEPFGLVSNRRPPVHCHIAPDTGMPRSLVADIPSNAFRLQNPSPPHTADAWFTGNADIRCNGPVAYLPPQRYDDTVQHVVLGLCGLSTLLLLIVVVQSLRRLRSPAIRRSRIA